MNFDTIFMIIDRLDSILGLIGFIVSVVSFAKIKNVEKSLGKQKDTILFNKKYRSFCKEIDNLLAIMKKDGIKNTFPSIVSLCDKILRYTGGVGKKEQRELNGHIKAINKAYETDSNNADEKIVLELNAIKNLLESVGEKNDI